MKVIDADALMTDICDSIDKMTEVGIPVDGEWLWTKLNHAIKHAPTIETERKKGKWILKDLKWECDKCGCRIRRAKPFSGNIWNYYYCPNCGVQMIQEGENNE